MEIIGYLIFGLLTGGVAAWFISASRAKSAAGRTLAEMQASHAAKTAEIEAKAVSSEALVGELRSQTLRKDGEIDLLRRRMDETTRERTEALTRLEEARKNFEEQKLLIEAMKTEMTDTFNALSRAALESSNESFLTLASERLGKVVEETKGRLGEHQTAMDGMIKPLSDALRRYEDQIRVMEEGRHKAFGSLEEQLRTLTSTHENLQKETSNLVTALRRPEVRGRWGEMQLRRVAELSGMSMHCDFTEQQSVDTEKGRVRPDMIVHLPMEREIVVDSKVSLDAYLDAISAATEEERKAKMDRHAQQVRTHMLKLGSKEYWSQFRQSPEFVVLFIPGESFLSSALQSDPALIEDGIQRRVIIATPTTFVALLRAIAYGWRQEQMTKNAQQISLLGRELYERMSTLAKYFADMGNSIDKTVASYNKVVGSMESRVLPSVRKFRELGVSAPEEIPVIEPLEQKTRDLTLPGM